LQSRGIDKAKAEAILLNAFAQEIVEKIKIPVLKEIVSNQIVKRIKLD
jgi:Fe-S cluster assembly protein SufD